MCVCVCCYGQVKKPQVMDHPVLDFPYSLLQLQADIRKVSGVEGKWMERVR